MTRRPVLWMFVGAVFLNLALFALYTFPAVLHPNLFWTDAGDGLQNVWNLWWIHKAVTQLHETIWFTKFLHFPFGTTLVVHTLNPVNGLLAIPLVSLLGLASAFNTILLFAFVTTGVAVTWLAWELTRSKVGSLFAGIVFTFSNYHFAHAEGHLQLVTTQWLVVFLVLWLRAWRNSDLAAALFAAPALALVLYSDYYYFGYAIVAALLMTALIKPEDRRDSLQGIGLFLFVGALVLVSPLARFATVVFHDSFLGSHDPRIYSMDLLAPFIPGGHWRWSSLTAGFWTRLPGNIHESSVYIGWSVLILAVVGVYRWKDRALVRFWAAAGALFFMMALGPRLQVAGHPVVWFPLPYALAERLLPFIALSGCPVRMAVIVMLAASVLAAAGFSWLWENRRGLAYFVAVVALIESWPKTIPIQKPDVPAYVTMLRSTGDRDAVIDSVADQSAMLYRQTVHEHPCAMGYVSRLPLSVWKKDQPLLETANGGDPKVLYRDYSLRYWAIPTAAATQPRFRKLTVAYADAQATVYDLSR